MSVNHLFSFFPAWFVLSGSQGGDVFQSMEFNYIKHNVCSAHQIQTLTFFSVLNVEDRCSLAPAMDILSYSEREWRGNTAKSALIRKVSAPAATR